MRIPNQVRTHIVPPSDLGLTTLNLCSNNIGEDGGISLASCLINNQKLRTLDVSYNPLGIGVVRPRSYDARLHVTYDSKWYSPDSMFCPCTDCKQSYCKQS